MLGKRNVMTLIMFAGIVFLAGAVFFLVSANSTSLKNGTLDLSEWDGQHAIALVGKAEFSQDELMLQQTSKSPEQDNLVNFPPSRNYYEIRKKHVPGMEKGTYLIHVTGAKPDQTLALRIPPYLLTYRIYIDGKLAEPRDKNEAAEDGSVSRYEVETFEFIPAHESFNIAIQLSHSDYPFSVGYSAFYLGNVGQIERINSVICGYDIFVIAFLLVIVFYNVFYYFLRKDLFFIIFVLMCLMMIGRTLISGSFLISSVLSNPGPRTALYIDYFTAFFLPVSWLSITYLSNAVVLSKTAIKLSLFYAIAISLASFIVPFSALMLLYMFSELIWLATAIYIILKSVEVAIMNQLNRTSAILLLSGTTILTLCSVLNILQNIFSGRGLLDFFPIGLILFAMLWDYSYTYQYDTLLKDRLKVLENLNVAYENGRALELKFLRSQIRPHFMNNVLNTIISVSLTDSERSRNLLCHLSTYLKSCYDFGESDNSVTIEYELSVVRAFVALEEARFTDSLHVEYKIDSIAIDIPPLILQPLVENAIKHNKISKKSPLSVCIYVIKNEESVKIGVRDNGQGFDPEAIPALLSGELNGQGVGIYNVNMRLEKIYGTTLKIENLEGGGCDVYMIIPYSRLDNLQG